MDSLTAIEYWKAIVLYGLNNATYKIALAKSLLDFSRQGLNRVTWEQLSKSFLDNYIHRLSVEGVMPQQANPARLTVMERIVKELTSERISYSAAISRVGAEAFGDVIPRFQTIGTDKELAKGRFYEFQQGKGLLLKDGLLEVGTGEIQSLYQEVEARWSLLEGAFSINQTHAGLSNDLRDIYLQNGYARTNLTPNIPFLLGYQGNACFYCGEELQKGDIHVDHVLPRQVVSHDEIWNLVLTHGYCNESKSDRLVASYYIEKLAVRNENIMGSNHPWKQKIQSQLGDTAKTRRRSLAKHYEHVKSILGAYYWGGVDNYILEKDPFFRKLITILNNG
ncbi:HNH endonuclease domain-containing protein [Pseudocnuella soli]|uniref:HNH endonuclease domain-containing protein n=1 Tax=Pseudocnuella soli TaxID=2502779 RepID=UPI00104B4440|nr:HNH endonuclease domain-containing protein [Pseudocnuella soli]